MALHLDQFVLRQASQVAVDHVGNRPQARGEFGPS